MSDPGRAGRRMQSIQSDLTIAPRPVRVQPPAETAELKPVRPATATPSAVGPIRPPAKASDQVSVTRSISFTTPVPTRNQLRRTAHERDTTLTQLVLDAIEANIDQLDDLVAAEQPSKIGGEGKLFPQREYAVPRSEEPRVATSLRIGSDNLRVLDELVGKHHADNRSQLITAVLRAYLK